MATLNSSSANPSYADIAKRLDPDGKIDQIIELLEEDNPFIQDAVVIEANQATAHRTTVRSGLPAATWRLLNYGVSNSKSRTVQVQDSIGMLEAYAEVDKALADLNGNTASFRLSEDKAFLESMTQEIEDTLFYGNTASAPEEFIGLAPRYNSLSADSGANIIDAGGTGSDNMSIWFVTWGADTTHLIYPKGTIAGWQHNDLGEHTLEDAAGGQYQGYRTHYKWDVGLTLRDWRYTARVCNIDVSNLTGGSYTTLIKDMTKAMYKLHKIKSGLRIYTNRTGATYLDILAQDKTNVNLTYREFAGKPVTTFRGIPVRVTDALLETEAQIT